MTVRQIPVVIDKTGGGQYTSWLTFLSTEGRSLPDSWFFTISGIAGFFTPGDAIAFLPSGAAGTVLSISGVFIRIEITRPGPDPTTGDSFTGPTGGANVDTIDFEGESLLVDVISDSSDGTDPIDFDSNFTTSEEARLIVSVNQSVRHSGVFDGTGYMTFPIPLVGDKFIKLSPYQELRGFYFEGDGVGHVSYIEMNIQTLIEDCIATVINATPAASLKIFINQNIVGAYSTVRNCILNGFWTSIAMAGATNDSYIYNNLFISSKECIVNNTVANQHYLWNNEFIETSVNVFRITGPGFKEVRNNLFDDDPTIDSLIDSGNRINAIVKFKDPLFGDYQKRLQRNYITLIFRLGLDLSEFDPYSWQGAISDDILGNDRNSPWDTGPFQFDYRPGCRDWLFSVGSSATSAFRTPSSVGKQGTDFWIEYNIQPISFRRNQNILILHEAWELDLNDRCVARHEVELRLKELFWSFKNEIGTLRVDENDVTYDTTYTNMRLSEITLLQGSRNDIIEYDLTFVSAEDELIEAIGRRQVTWDSTINFIFDEVVNLKKTRRTNNKTVLKPIFRGPPIRIDGTPADQDADSLFTVDVEVTVDMVVHWPNSPFYSGGFPDWLDLAPSDKKVWLEKFEASLETKKGKTGTLVIFESETAHGIFDSSDTRNPAELVGYSVANRDLHRFPTFTLSFRYGFLV